MEKYMNHYYCGHGITDLKKKKLPTAWGEEFETKKTMDCHKCGMAVKPFASEIIKKGNHD